MAFLVLRIGSGQLSPRVSKTLSAIRRTPATQPVESGYRYSRSASARRGWMFVALEPPGVSAAADRLPSGDSRCYVAERGLVRQPPGTTAGGNVRSIKQGDGPSGGR